VSSSETAAGKHQGGGGRTFSDFIVIRRRHAKTFVRWIKTPKGHFTSMNLI
jgi:hypothetical protein